MARVQIEFPEERIFFRHDVSVRVSDENFFGHMGHDALISIMHEARAQLFIANGVKEDNTQGGACIVADLAVSYRSEAHFPQMLVVEMACGDIENFGCELYYQVRQKDGGKVVALARTGHVFFKGRESTLVPVPEKFKQIITTYL